LPGFLRNDKNGIDVETHSPDSNGYPTASDGKGLARGVIVDSGNCSKSNRRSQTAPEK